MPDPAAGPPASAGRPGWLTMLLIAVSFYCALLLDPFGIGTASTERSEQAALRITAPFYADSGQVVVVLIDDDYLARVRRSWPVPYADQGRLLRSILQARPAVLYLDILYRQAHTDLERNVGLGTRDAPLDLVTPIESFTGTQLIFSAQVPTSLRAGDLPSLCSAPTRDQRAVLDDRDSLLPELRGWLGQRRDQARVAVLGWWGCGDQYPLQLAGDPDGATPTPAIAMLNAWCASGNRTDAGCRTLREPNADDPLPPMVVRWGAFPPAAQQPFYTAGVCQPYADAAGGVGFFRALRASFTQLVLGIFEDLRNAPKPELALPCPAVTVLPASVVRFGDPEEVAALLRDRIVLLGARVTGVSDWHVSPVHGQVPGVLLHAAAIDNLLSLGGRYASNLPDGALLSLALFLLAVMAFCVPVLVIVLDEPRKQLVSLVGLGVWVFIAWFLWRAGASAGSVFAAFVIAVAIDLLMPLQTLVYLLAVALLALGAALLIWFGVAPANWIGMVLIGLAFASAVKPFFKQDDLKRFPHPVSFLGDSVRKYQQRFQTLEFHGAFDRAIDWASRVAARLDRAGPENAATGTGSGTGQGTDPATDATNLPR